MEADDANSSGRVTRASRRLVSQDRVNSSESLVGTPKKTRTKRLKSIGENSVLSKAVAIDSDDNASTISSHSNSTRDCKVVLERTPSDTIALATRSRKSSTLTEDNVAKLETKPALRRSTRSQSVQSDETASTVTRTRTSARLASTQGTPKKSTTVKVEPKTPVGKRSGTRSQAKTPTRNVSMSQTIIELSDEDSADDRVSQKVDTPKNADKKKKVTATKRSESDAESVGGHSQASPKKVGRKVADAKKKTESIKPDDVLDDLSDTESAQSQHSRASVKESVGGHSQASPKKAGRKVADAKKKTKSTKPDDIIDDLSDTESVQSLASAKESAGGHSQASPKKAGRKVSDAKKKTKSTKPDDALFDLSDTDSVQSQLSQASVKEMRRKYKRIIAVSESSDIETSTQQLKKKSDGIVDQKKKSKPATFDEKTGTAGVNLVAASQKDVPVDENNESKSSKPGKLTREITDGEKHSQSASKKSSSNAQSKSDSGKLHEKLDNESTEDTASGPSPTEQISSQLKSSISTETTKPKEMIEDEEVIASSQPVPVAIHSKKDRRSTTKSDERVVLVSAVANPNTENNESYAVPATSHVGHEGTQEAEAVNDTNDLAQKSPSTPANNKKPVKSFWSPDMTIMNTTVEPMEVDVSMTAIDESTTHTASLPVNETPDNFSVQTNHFKLNESSVGATMAKSPKASLIKNSSETPTTPNMLNLSKRIDNLYHSILGGNDSSLGDSVNVNQIIENLSADSPQADDTAKKANNEKVDDAANKTIDPSANDTAEVDVEISEIGEVAANTNAAISKPSNSIEVNIMEENAIDEVADVTSEDYSKSVAKNITESTAAPSDNVSKDTVVSLETDNEAVAHQIEVAPADTVPKPIQCRYIIEAEPIGTESSNVLNSEVIEEVAEKVTFPSDVIESETAVVAESPNTSATENEGNSNPVSNESLHEPADDLVGGNVVTEHTTEEQVENGDRDESDLNSSDPQQKSVKFTCCTPKQDRESVQKRQDTPYPDDKVIKEAERRSSKGNTASESFQAKYADVVTELRSEFHNIANSWNKAVVRHDLDENPTEFIDGDGAHTKEEEGSSNVKKFTTARNALEISKGLIDSESESENDDESVVGELSDEAVSTDYESDSNDFIDDKAEVAEDYVSGDSMDEDERRERDENEIVDDGESVGSSSDDEDEEGGDEAYEKDSFIADSDEEQLIDDEDKEIGLINERSPRKFRRISRINTIESSDESDVEAPSNQSNAREPVTSNAVEIDHTEQIIEGKTFATTIIAIDNDEEKINLPFKSMENQHSSTLLDVTAAEREDEINHGKGLAEAVSDNVSIVADPVEPIQAHDATAHDDCEEENNQSSSDILNNDLSMIPAETTKIGDGGQAAESLNELDESSMMVNPNVPHQKDIDLVKQPEKTIEKKENSSSQQIRDKPAQKEPKISPNKSLRGIHPISEKVKVTHLPRKSLNDIVPTVHQPIAALDDEINAAIASKTVATKSPATVSSTAENTSGPEEADTKPVIQTDSNGSGEASAAAKDTNTSHLNRSSSTADRSLVEENNNSKKSYQTATVEPVASVNISEVKDEPIEAAKDSEETAGPSGLTNENKRIVAWGSNEAQQTEAGASGSAFQIQSKRKRNVIDETENEPQIPDTKVKRRLKIHSSSGPFIEEPMTPEKPNRFGFRESPLTPQAKNFKVRKVVQNVNPAKKRKSFHLDNDESNLVLPKPRWYRGEPNITESSAKRPKRADTETMEQILKPSNKKKVKARDLIPIEMLTFRLNRLCRTGIPRHSSKDLLLQRHKEAANKKS